MNAEMQFVRYTRRTVYRQAKRILEASLRARWQGSRLSLRRVVQAWLKGKNRRYLLRLVRQGAFAVAVAGALFAGTLAHASSPIELSDVAAGTGGFVINGIDALDISGGSVSGAGDVNGDGVADLVVGAIWAAPGGESKAGESYVVFGKATGTAVELSAIASGTGGFVINGIDMDDYSGRSVSCAGDVNGDGLDDLVVGADRADPGGDSNAGESYVVFGKADGTAVELSAITSGTGGFVINGADAGDLSGISVSGAGDVNGDGLDDLVVGARNGRPGGVSYAGESYVVFGKASGTAVELSTVASGTGGFVINGIDSEDHSGESVSGAGDVNGDGLDDLLVGAKYARPGGVYSAGESYVVFGKSTGAAVELSAIVTGTGGFVINGIDADDDSGVSVSGAGDVNGDGLADLIIGSNQADPGGDSFAGESSVVFGKADGTAVELSAITSGTGGFVINGIDYNDGSGRSVSGAGDVNGDGLADLIVGAQGADPGGYNSAGESYVVFGKADGTTVELSAVAAGTGGFVLNGIDMYDFSGVSVSGAGDVNGDGLADVIVGASSADPGGRGGAGESYVVFSPETAPTSATYKATSRAGDGAGGDPVVLTVLEDARFTIDYSDEDSADNGSGGASLETVSLGRGLGDLTGLPADYATTYWDWSTDRVNWTDATFTFKYLDTEIVALLGAEVDYTVYSATSKSGPWTAQTTTIDTARNTAEITMAVPGNASFFAIGDPAPPPPTPPAAWVDFAWTGTETGTEAEPFNTLGEALGAVSAGDIVAIKGDTADGDSSETPTINQEVTITADGGTVMIGNPAARDARDGAAEEGFVSKER